MGFLVCLMFCFEMILFFSFSSTNILSVSVCSAHPARFSPDDKFSRERIVCKKRFNILRTQVQKSNLKLKTKSFLRCSKLLFDSCFCRCSVAWQGVLRELWMFCSDLSFFLSLSLLFFWPHLSKQSTPHQHNVSNEREFGREGSSTREKHWKHVDKFD